MNTVTKTPVMTSIALLMSASFFIDDFQGKCITNNGLVLLRVSLTDLECISPSTTGEVKEQKTKMLHCGIAQFISGIKGIVKDFSSGESRRKRLLPHFSINSHTTKSCIKFSLDIQPLFPYSSPHCSDSYTSQCLCLLSNKELAILKEKNEKMETS